MGLATHPLMQPGPMRLQGRVPMTANLTRHHAPRPPMTLRPFHNRGNRETKARRNHTAGLTRQNRSQNPFLKIK